MFGWHRGRGVARGQPCQNPSLSPFHRHPCRPRPPVPDHHPTDALEPTPPRSVSPAAPHARLGHRHRHREHPIGAARHRPFPDLSLCHQPRAEPLDRFPAAEDLDLDRTRHPDPAR
jgi:hypothetical protein